MSSVYKKRFGLFHDSAVAKEIASLDEHEDVQRIVHLMAVYEFSWDISRALELALFYTYGSVPVSRLLDRTAEFQKFGQKRYDDTAILIGHFVESGWDGDFGRKALDRMNKTHTHYTIPNDDFLFVLWTFIEFPIRWTDSYGRRRMTDHEKRAWFNFWAVIGQRMRLKDIPASKALFDEFVLRYEAEHFVYSDANQRVADATVQIMANWFPSFMRPGVKPIVYCLMPENFLRAVGFPTAPRWARSLVSGVLKLSGAINRIFPFAGYPHLVMNRKERTYTQGYQVEELQPVHLSKHEAGKKTSSEAPQASVVNDSQ